MAAKMGLSSVLSSQPHDSSLGTLHARLMLDYPKQIHYGSDDPVSGHVVVRLDRTAGKTTTAELFGPLEINILLRGVMRIVSGSGATSDPTSQDDNVFVTKTVKLHSGPFRAEQGSEHEFHFAINFPEHTEAKHKIKPTLIKDDEGNWRSRIQRTDTIIDDLPPSLTSKEKYAIVKSDMSIRYGISLQVSMPGIDIKIMNPAIEREILYDRPRVPAIAATMQSDQTTSFKQQLSVEHKDLLAPENRLSGFKRILKSTGPVPKYVFDVTCTGVPQHIFIGQPINFRVSYSTDWNKTTANASDIPNVSLDNCTISLIGNTRGKRSDYSFTQEELITTEVLKEKTCEVVGLTSSTPGDVDVGTLSAVPSTFTHEDMSRDYKLKVALTFCSMGQTMKVLRMFGVTVHPPLLEDGAGADPDGVDYAVAGDGADDAERAVSPLPSYDAVMGGAGVTPSYFERIPPS